MLFQDGQVVAVLDFGFLAVRERVYELAYTLYWALEHLAPDMAPAQKPWNEAVTLLRAYNAAARRPLADVEWRDYRWKWRTCPSTGWARLASHLIRSDRSSRPALDWTWRAG